LILVASLGCIIIGSFSEIESEKFLVNTFLFYAFKDEITPDVHQGCNIKGI
jgi:hypothetical protein